MTFVNWNLTPDTISQSMRFYGACDLDSRVIRVEECYGNRAIATELWHVVNPRLAGAPKLPWSAGGGASRRPPPSNLAPRRRSEKQKVAFKSSSKSISKLLRSFFSLRPILRSPEVIKRQISRNSICLRKCAVIAETIIGRKPRKSAIDSP